MSAELPCELSLRFTATAPVYDFFTNGNDKLVAGAYSRVKWDKNFQESVKKSRQTHYEQYGRVSGSVKVGEEEITLENIPAVRDHSFGRRDWAFMLRHIWLCGVSESGKAFNVSMVNYPIADGIRAGNLFDGKDIVNFSDFTFEGDTSADGKGADEVTVHITTVEGNGVTVTGKRTAETVYYLQNGEYSLREGFGSFELNGEKYFGIWEFGFNKDRNLW